MEQNPHMSPEANVHDYPDLEGKDGEEVEAPNLCEEQSAFRESSTPKRQEVQSETSIVDQLENRLAVGQVMKSVEDAYLLYCNYAHAKGFSVKKGDQRYFPGTSELQAKDFECSCEGAKDKKRSNDRVPIYQKSTSRTKCKARLRVRREKGREWRVTTFVMQHNHEMVPADQTHLLRSSRNNSHAQKSIFEAMVNAGIPVAHAVCMEEEAHEPQSSGSIRRDACDYLSRLRKHTKVENGDASELVKHFICKSNNEPFFYWDMQLDDDNRPMNFFFRDYRCRIDYELFGDVLSIDATSTIDRHKLTYVPFVGINHHNQNVMFGLAFMSDETEDSFEWLFRTFRESMGSKQPETIFTDQCQAMMNAIETIFPCSHHQLCQWHINRNAPSHLGNLNYDSRFKQLWNKCMNHFESEEEFEATWKHMIDEFDLSGHSWLNGMYNLRHKWATAFSNEKFSAGFLGTSRSESTSSVLKKASDRTISLYNFVFDYEKIQETSRANEKAEDTRCRDGKPPMIVKNNPLLNHAADVYTINMYNLFESELVESLSTEFTEQPSFVGPWLIPFKVKSHGEKSRVREVVFDKHKNEIKCSCRKFESMGILCKHALKVLNFVNVHSIPERYIKKRWKKNIRNRVPDEGSGHISEVVFVNQSMRLVYDLSVRCKAHEETRNMLTEFLHGATKKINDWFENLSLNNRNAGDDLIGYEDTDQSNEMLVCNSKRRRRRTKEKAVNPKGTKQKRQISETATDECPSQEATHAQMSQQATDVQLSPYPIVYPFQGASIAFQSNAYRPHWPYPISFPTLSPTTRNMHLATHSNNNRSQPN